MSTRSIIHDVFSTKLLLLAALRTGMGRRGPGDMKSPRNPNAALLRVRVYANHRSFPHRAAWYRPKISAQLRNPACVKHHRTGADSYHRFGPRKFALTRNLDIPAIVGRLSTKPIIRVEAGWFVAYLDDQRYVLGKTEAGIRLAIREALQLCRENRVQEIAS